MRTHHIFGEKVRLLVGVAPTVRVFTRGLALSLPGPA